MKACLIPYTRITVLHLHCPHLSQTSRHTRGRNSQVLVFYPPFLTNAFTLSCVHSDDTCSCSKQKKKEKHTTKEGRTKETIPPRSKYFVVPGSQMLAAIASVTYPPRTTGPKGPLIVNQTAAYFLLLKPSVEENGPLNIILKEAGSRTRSAGMVR